MKMLSAAVVCAAAMLPVLAHAETSGAQLLGLADAVANYCSKVDHGNTRRFEAAALGMFGLGKLPEDTAEKSRHDPQYQEAHDLMEAALSQLTKADGKRACAWLLAQPGVAPPSHGSKGPEPDK